jgi:small subunit ribosomal protein S3
MGQKISPIGFRVGITEPWRSRWYARKKEFGPLILEDAKIRRYVRKEYKFAAISRIEIERSGEEIRVIIFTARPGVLIGKKGAKIDKLKEELEALTKRKVAIDTKEITVPELDANLVAQGIAEQLEKRASFRRTMKKAMQATMNEGALGVKLQLAGRLGGSEMARCELSSLGSIPLQALRAIIDYGFAEASTAYGNIGVKCWIYKGEHRPEAVK